MASFGNKFNQLVDLPSSIVYLKLACDNTSIIDYLPESIEELELDYDFNLELNNLPNSIKKIRFYNYNKELNCLPSSVELLQLPFNYTHKILNIPKGLKKVICSSNYKYISDFDNIEVETYC